MQNDELFCRFTAPLTAADIPHMVSGSVACMVYGEPRLTNDVDIVLTLEAAQVHDFAGLFPPEEFYCPPEEVIGVELRRPHRGHFNLIHHDTGHKADVYLAGHDSLAAWGLRHRRSIEIAPGRHLWIAPPEYVILMKLEYYREGGSEKHATDIRGMMAVSGDRLDREVLHHHLQRMNLGGTWRAVITGA